ncbi:MAG TPA: DUF2231 domain-containing protein [Rhodothermales bacterium]|nr:DUF2231 domain-containing protein [Rhodothermales bacterium]
MDLDTLFSYELPYLHPVVVHAPPVLLVVAFAAAVGYAVAGGRAWRLAALALFAAGAVSAWVAGQTGEALYDGVEGEPQVEALIGLHHTAAGWTLWSAAVAALLFLAVTLWLRRTQRPDPAPLALRLLLLIPALVAALAVAVAGHAGGLMVWGVPV